MVKPPLLSDGAYPILKSYRFVDEHDGNAVAHQISTPTVLTNKQGFEFRRDLVALEILQRALAGLILKASNQGAIRQPDRLERLRATEDSEKLRIDRVGDAHRVEPARLISSS